LDLLSPIRVSAPRVEAAIAKAMPRRDTDAADEGRLRVRIAETAGEAQTDPKPSEGWKDLAGLLPETVERMRAAIAARPITSTTLARRIDGLEDLYVERRRILELRGAQAPIHDAFGVRDASQAELRFEIGRREAALARALATRGFGSIDDFDRATAAYAASFAGIAAVEALATLGRFERIVAAEVAKANDAEHVAGLAAALAGTDVSRLLTSAQQREVGALWIAEPHAPAIRERRALDGAAATERAEAHRQLDALTVAYPILSLPGIDRETIALAPPERLRGVLLGLLEDQTDAIETLRKDLCPELALGLDEAVRAAKRDLGVATGSIHDLVIDDRIRAGADARAGKALALAGISTALALVSGGTAGLVSIAASGAALGAGVFQAMNELHAYELAHAAHTTELLTEKPELGWVVLAIASAGLDAAAAYSALKAIRPAAAAFHATRDVARLERQITELVAIDAKLRSNVVRAARAQKRLAAAFDDLLELTHRMYSSPIPPEVIARGARVVFHLLERGAISFDSFRHGLKAHAIAVEIRAVPEETLRRIFDASEIAAREIDAHGRTLGMSRGQVHAIVHAWAHSPEPMTPSAIHSEMTRWAAPPPTLDAALSTAASNRIADAVGDLDAIDLADLETAVELASDLGPVEAAVAGRRAGERLAREADAAPLASFPEIAGVARQLGGDVERSVLEGFAGRTRKEIAVMRTYGSGRQSRAVAALRAAADDAGLDIHTLLRRSGPPPSLDTMSRGARRALKEIDSGARAVWVGSRAEAEAILAAYPSLVDTGGWGLPMIKDLLREGKNLTYHWDDVFGPKGYLLHHTPPNPHRFERHLQLHMKDGRTARVFFRGT
jgi:hypothetical protein